MSCISLPLGDFLPGLWLDVRFADGGIRRRPGTAHTFLSLVAAMRPPDKLLLPFT